MWFPCEKMYPPRSEIQDELWIFGYRLHFIAFLLLFCFPTLSQPPTTSTQISQKYTFIQGL